MIYYALTSYQILCCVLHKMTANSGEKAVLLLSDIHKNSLAFAKRYKDSGIFEDVVILSELEVLDYQRWLEKRKIPTSVILRKCCSRMGNVLKKAGIHTKGQRLYLCPDHFPFGWYVIAGKMKYTDFEEGCGVMSDREFALNNMKRNATQYKLFHQLKCFGDNQYATQVLCDTQLQKEGYTNEKMVDFSVIRILKAMTDAERKKVLEFFGYEGDEKLSSEGSLLLTQHMANLGLMTLPQQHEFYKLFADYFIPTDSQLVIKPHPDDIAGLYSREFGEKIKVLPFAMPSELLEFCMSGKFRKICAAYSTAVNSMKDMSEDILCFDKRILRDWESIFLYDIAAKLCMSMGAGKVLTNGNELILNELLRMGGSNVKAHSFTVDEAEKCEAFIVSDNDCDNVEQRLQAVKKLLKSDLCDCIIFLNEKELYSYADGIDKTVFMNIRPVCIYIRGVKKMIYVYSKKGDLMEITNNFSYIRRLKYTDVEISANGISKSEAEKISILEGILAATEKRLEGYINEKKSQVTG